jgi:RimJ/RimL family protein N-acetyltransferase
MTFDLRLATLEDAEFLLACRNDPKTREASHNSHVIGLEEHLRWLNKTLNNPDQSLYIALELGVFVGTGRIDQVKNGHELSWAVAPAARGKGIGKKIVAALASRVLGPIYAEIKVNNLSSIAIAEFVGMELIKQEDDILHFGRGS